MLVYLKKFHIPISKIFYINNL